tara:strand:+ start:2206 stop:2421 length:216 start_codon:yes stop_codon:yes gene_type:complete
MFLIKSSKTRNLTTGSVEAKMKYLVSAQNWIANQKNPLGYSIWEFVGRDPDNGNHYTCVQTEGTVRPRWLI